MLKKQKRKKLKPSSKKNIKFIVFIALSISLLSIGLYTMHANNTSPNIQAQSAAFWGDGTNDFYKELISSDGSFEENAGIAIFDNQEVGSISEEDTADILAKAETVNSQVLGLHTASDGSEKWVEMDLSDLKLYAWEGSRKVHEFLISTGRPGYETPTGEYRVWRKVLSQRYRGGVPGTSSYYNLPNVPYSLFWGGGSVPSWKGYAIHGAYWHNDFGIKNRSSGCINVKPEEAGLLYTWAGPAMPDGVNALNSTDENPGIRVVIHE